MIKSLDQISLPDSRFGFFTIESKAGIHDFSLEAIHAIVSKTKFHDGVPQNVWLQFETVRNLMLYAWFVFEFQTVAEMQAYSTLELALRERFNHPKQTVKGKNGTKSKPVMLAELLRRAVKEGIIIPEKLPAWDRAQAIRNNPDPVYQPFLGQPPTASEWMAHVIEMIPKSRNELAHGTPKLYLLASLEQLALCADLVNAMFSK